METYYIIGRDDKIIAELRTTNQPNFRYILHAIANGFDVPIENIIHKTTYERNMQIYNCVVCGKVPVDVHDGYDTCPECVAKI